MDFNFLIILAAALIPMIIGAIWYNPKVLGKAWMQAAGLTEEKLKNANMVIILIVSFIFMFFLAFVMQMLVIHQIHTMAVLYNQPDSGDPNSTSMQLMKQFMELYGNSYRTFKHGAFHGTFSGIMIALPIIGTNALFERKGFKYIAINAGYWIISMALMGGVICAFS
jgi:hypothetical protein